MASTTVSDFLLTLAHSARHEKNVDGHTKTTAFTGHTGTARAQWLNMAQWPLHGTWDVQDVAWLTWLAPPSRFHGCSRNPYYPYGMETVLEWLGTRVYPSGLAPEPSTHTFEHWLTVY